MEFLIPIAFFVTVAVIVNIVIEKNTERMRLKIVERALTDQKMDTDLKALFESTIKQKETMVPIKWGLILVGLGLAMLIGHVVPFFYDDKATLSLMFLLSGLGLIIYHLWFFRTDKN